MSQLLPDGIIAICALSGAPVSAAENALFEDVQGVVEQYGKVDQAMRLIVVDQTPERGDTGVWTAQGQMLVFLGDLDDGPALAAELNFPPHTSASQLVLHALHRWGDMAPRHLPGLWTLLLWETSSRCLTLVSSLQLRNQIYVARVGDRLAISSSLLHLSRLPWMGKHFDPQGLHLTLGRAPLRAQLDDGCLLKNAKRVLPGRICRYWSGGQTSTTRASPIAIEPWKGDVFDAIQTLEVMARRAVRRSLRRHRTIAVTLSGGLDSSTLAWLAASEKRPSQKVIAIASAARVERCIPDERKWIDLVARHLDLDVHYAVPEESTDVYMPSDIWFSGMETPLAAHGHYVYQNMFRIAKQAGADAVLEGVYGEYSLTRKVEMHTADLNPYIRLRRLLGRMRRSLGRIGGGDISDYFHVRISRQAEQLFPGDLSRFLPVDSTRDTRKMNGLMGLVPGHEKSFLVSENSPVIGIRDMAPFRDPAMLAFAAALPAAFTQDGPYARALVRRMIKPHLPEEISLRTCKRPFSPEHDYLLRQQAERRRQAIKAMDVSCDWLDLAWLDRALGQISDGKNDFTTGRVAQSTSCALAFFDWWERA
jgi:asparagine synthase (glutamine-hydrolysing)